jgi:hypothetical protein
MSWERKTQLSRPSILSMKPSPLQLPANSRLVLFSRGVPFSSTAVQPNGTLPLTTCDE